MPAPRSCIFPGCHNLNNDSVSLFKFPKSEELRKRWIDFVRRHTVGELKITANSHLCSNHFTTDSFHNYYQKQLGFTSKPLLLVNEAEPTVSLPGLHPSVALTSSATVGCNVKIPPMSQTLPTTRDAACQCDDLQEATREIGCQTDCYVGRRTVATQLSKRTLYNRKTTGSQATVVTRSVAVGNSTSQFLPLCYFTRQKRRAGQDDGPQAKRSLLVFPSLQESDITSVSADPDDSSYLPSISALDDTISDQIFLEIGGVYTFM